MPADPFAKRKTERQHERKQLVQRQMAARGIRDEAVLEAMAAVPRHAFVPGDLDEYAKEAMDEEAAAQVPETFPFGV